LRAAVAYLSGVVVVGLVVQGLTGAWWVDSITALALVPFLAREALEAWRNDDS
jgi:divalent metal cation (Fe/Co/Zn/Cd) transporter